MDRNTFTIPLDSKPLDKYKQCHENRHPDRNIVFFPVPDGNACGDDLVREDQKEADGILPAQGKSPFTRSVEPFAQQEPQNLPGWINDFIDFRLIPI